MSMYDGTIKLSFVSRNGRTVAKILTEAAILEFHHQFRQMTEPRIIF